MGTMKRLLQDSVNIAMLDVLYVMGLIWRTVLSVVLILQTLQLFTIKLNSDLTVLKNVVMDIGREKMIISVLVVIKLAKLATQQPQIVNHARILQGQSIITWIPRAMQSAQTGTTERPRATCAKLATRYAQNATTPPTTLAPPAPPTTSLSMALMNAWASALTASMRTQLRRSVCPVMQTAKPAMVSLRTAQLVSWIRGHTCF